MRRFRLGRFLAGAGAFGAAAGLATFHIMAEYPAGQFWLSIIALTSAAGSFAVVYWRDWRARSLALVPRAVVLGFTVVLGAHLLFGVFFYLVMAAAAVVNSGPAEFSHLGALAFSVVFAGGISLLNLYLTLPAGIAAALLFELMDRHSDPQVKRPAG